MKRLFNMDIALYFSFDGGVEGYNISLHITSFAHYEAFVHFDFAVDSAIKPNVRKPSMIGAGRCPMGVASQAPKGRISAIAPEAATTCIRERTVD